MESTILVLLSMAIRSKGRQLMENMKLPIALVIAMVLQISGGVWWVSQQAATIQSLEATVSEMSSRMAIEDAVNLRRDVTEHGTNIDELWEETEYLWESMDSFDLMLREQIKIKARISMIEKQLEFVDRDHMKMMENK